jgi:CDP-diacylglycerol--glycerol-3-phosphate 3-phosphatidyltransferase
MNLPNRITVGRLFIALLFFFGLGYYRLLVEFKWNPLDMDERLVLNLSLGLFLLAVVTDALDGYIARRTGQVTAFGRIADPFVDKVVICGSFVFLAAMHAQLGDLVWPSMVVLILGREFLVTSLRGLVEASGEDFGARASGKVKMVVQSVTIAWILFYRANLWETVGRDGEPEMGWARILAVVLLWATIVLTIASGIDSILRARKVIGKDL